MKYIFIFFELLLLIYFFNIITNKNLSDSNNNFKNINIELLNLKDKLFKQFKKNISNIDTLYIEGYMRFGNYLVSLNNAIIFCELLKCKRIIVKNDFINHKIFYQKFNLTIEPNKLFNYFIDDNSMIINVGFFFSFYIFKSLGKVNRFFVFRKEILNNLPKVETNIDELYIYIRSGDIFRHINYSKIYYAQPPLCFYKTVLNQFKFRNVTIISEDISNPVIPILLKEFPYIKYNSNALVISIMSSSIQCIALDYHKYLPFISPFIRNYKKKYF
jgi:hypothetical protein